MTMMDTHPTNVTRSAGPRPPRGFSLIELVLVITIVSILAAIAVPRYAGALARYRADAAAQRVVSDLAYARELARSQSRSVAVEMETTTDSIHLSGVPNPDGDGDWFTRLDRSPYHADVTSVDFSGGTDVTFDGYGYPDTAGKVLVSVGSEVRTITLDAVTGKAVAQ